MPPYCPPEYWDRSYCAHSFDHTATKTKAVIVPACGFDSLPSDLAVFLSNRTLKNALGPQTQLGLSQSFFDVKGAFSGGSFATMVAEIEQVPRGRLAESHKEYALSPGTAPAVPIHAYDPHTHAIAIIITRIQSLKRIYKGRNGNRRAAKAGGNCDALHPPTACKCRERMTVHRVL